MLPSMGNGDAVEDLPTLTPKRESRKEHKVYEELLMQQISGENKKTHQAIHAVLEAALEDSEEEIGVIKGVRATVKVRNHALIHYIAQLASSNHDNDTFDFSFVESLIKNGADINAKDKHGQTVFHEVARSWHLDVAHFLLKHGARINEQDKYGRAPLHVAAAVDYAKMVEFLINNGADINIKTEGEQQSPIHFAAKNDACQSLKMLLAYEADIGARDYQQRTPLQVAAEMSRSKTAKLLIGMGAPAGVYDMKGEVVLSLLILKMPEVAVAALNQLHSADTINRKEYYFLNYLEGPRLLKDNTTGARTPLEVSIQTQQFDVITHPVMQRLINIKWQRFGKRGACLDLAVNILFAILLTILGVTLPNKATELYEPLRRRWWRLALVIAVILLTVLEISKQVTSIYRLRKSLAEWKGNREKELRRDLPYCHPRWPEEKRFLDSEIKSVTEQRLLSSQDGWFYIDWFALILILASVASHAAFYFLDKVEIYKIHVRILCFLLIVFWIRIIKYARSFKGPGPFVAIFSQMRGEILIWVFLFLIVYIPYTSCFWMVFGSYSKTPTSGFRTVSQLLYSVFSITVLDNYDFEELDGSDPAMARILCGSYVFFCSIIVMNLLIALLANTFTRIYAFAIENAAMQKAKTILNIERSLCKRDKKKYYDFIRENCSPQMSNYEPQVAIADHEKKRQTEEMKFHVKDMHSVINERFSRRFGEKGKSAFDDVNDNISEVMMVYPKISTYLRIAMIRLNVLEQRISKVAAKTSPNEESKVKWKDYPNRQSTSRLKSTSSKKKKRTPDPSIDIKMRLASAIQKRPRSHSQPHSVKNHLDKTTCDSNRSLFRQFSYHADGKKTGHMAEDIPAFENTSLSDDQAQPHQKLPMEQFNFQSNPLWSKDERGSRCEPTEMTKGVSKAFKKWKKMFRSTHEKRFSRDNEKQQLSSLPGDENGILEVSQLPHPELVREGRPLTQRSDFSDSSYVTTDN